MTPMRLVTIYTLAEYYSNSINTHTVNYGKRNLIKTCVQSPCSIYIVLFDQWSSYSIKCLIFGCPIQTTPKMGHLKV